MAAPSSDLMPYNGPTVSDFAPGANAGLWLMFGIVTVVLALRTGMRTMKKPVTFGLDDMLLLISWCLVLATAAVYDVALSAARNLDDPTVVMIRLPRAIYFFLVASSMGILAVCVPKIAVAALIVRAFALRRGQMAMLAIPAVILVFFSIVLIIVGWVQCDPIEGQWNPAKHPNTKCWNPAIQRDLSFAFGASSAFLDLLYATYPAFIIAKLQMPRSRKIQLSCVLGIGYLAAAFAIYKTSLFGSLDESTIDSTLYSIGRISLWTLLEAEMILFAAALPVVPQAIRGVWEKASSLWSKQSGFSASETGPKKQNAPLSEDSLDRYEPLSGNTEPDEVELVNQRLRHAEV